MKKRDLKSTHLITGLLAVIMMTEQVGGVLPMSSVYAEGKAEDKCVIEYNVNSTWEGGCNAEINIQNLADTDTKDWSATFCSSDDITDIWGGKITECLEITDDNNEYDYGHYYKYTIEAVDYTRCIPAGSQVIVGYNAKGNTHIIWDAEAELIFMIQKRVLDQMGEMILHR